MFNENAYQARSTRARKRRLKFTLSGQRLPKEDSFDVLRRLFCLLCNLVPRVLRLFGQRGRRRERFWNRGGGGGGGG